MSKTIAEAIADGPRQAGHFVNMEKLERELSREPSPLDEIAGLVRELTYGEMIELAAAIWAARPDDAAATNADWLAPTLHRWATGDNITIAC
jgi:hypothetical protein